MLPPDIKFGYMEYVRLAMTPEVLGELTDIRQKIIDETEQILGGKDKVEGLTARLEENISLMEEYALISSSDINDVRIYAQHHFQGVGIESIFERREIMADLSRSYGLKPTFGLWVVSDSGLTVALREGDIDKLMENDKYSHESKVVSEGFIIRKAVSEAVALILLAKAGFQAMEVFSKFFTYDSVRKKRGVTDIKLGENKTVGIFCYDDFYQQAPFWRLERVRDYLREYIPLVTL